eukprot:scaffold2299_cov359-Prasinococcus_capsulatus_cf.AAC.5
MWVGGRRNLLPPAPPGRAALRESRTMLARVGVPATAAGARLGGEPPSRKRGGHLPAPPGSPQQQPRQANPPRNPNARGARCKARHSEDPFLPFSGPSSHALDSPIAVSRVPPPGGADTVPVWQPRSRTRGVESWFRPVAEQAPAAAGAAATESPVTALLTGARVRSGGRAAQQCRGRGSGEGGASQVRGAWAMSAHIVTSGFRDRSGDMKRDSPHPGAQLRGYLSFTGAPVPLPPATDGGSNSSSSSSGSSNREVLGGRLAGCIGGRWLRTPVRAERAGADSVQHITGLHIFRALTLACGPQTAGTSRTPAPASAGELARDVDPLPAHRPVA